MGLVEGLPVGMGAVGRPGSEALLLAVCRASSNPTRPTWRPPGRGESHDRSTDGGVKTARSPSRG